MGNLAALDVGTNSFHMVVARVRGNEFEVLTRERELVRLGHGGGDMKALEPAAIERGIAALRRMRRIADSHDAPLRAVATSAVREAANAEAFLARARADAGVEVDVVSGVEEARLIHLGVLQAVPVFDQTLILCDVGGGSTEVLVGRQGETLAARSFKLGAIRLTDRFFPEGQVTAKATRACRDFIRSTLAAFEHEVHELGYEVGIGSSGTFEAIAHLVYGDDDRRRTYNRMPVSREQLATVIDTLVGAPTAAARRKLPGMEPSRADIIVAGALIVEGVYDTFRVPTMVFSESALREGVLLDTLQRTNGSELAHLRDVQARSIRALAARCDPEPRHSEHVATLALSLFDQTQTLHGLDRGARNALEAGALLANVGLVISHDRHHVHSYYVVRNAEQLTGFTDHEIEVIALVARYHRKSAPKPSHEGFSGLSAEGQQRVRTLAGLLRVAIGLDRSHDQRVTEVSVRRTGQRLDIAVRSESDASLEIYAATERSALLSEVLQLDVAVGA